MPFPKKKEKQPKTAYIIFPSCEQNFLLSVDGSKISQSRIAYSLLKCFIFSTVRCLIEGSVVITDLIFFLFSLRVRMCANVNRSALVNRFHAMKVQGELIL